MKAEHALDASLNRARALCDIERYLSERYGGPLDCSDMLRAGVVLSVSAFDYFVHEVVRIEILRRFRTKRKVRGLNCSFDVLIADDNKRESVIDSWVREIHSYRSFVEPGKLAEIFKYFLDNPWEKIAAECGEESKSMKAKIRNIYKWRNRIAHEADIKPVLAGVECWPVDCDDVRTAIETLEGTGRAVVSILRQQWDEGDVEGAGSPAPDGLRAIETGTG